MESQVLKPYTCHTVLQLYNYYKSTYIAFLLSTFSNMYNLLFGFAACLGGDFRTFCNKISLSVGSWW